jgi:hypothetical protein
MTRRNRPLIIIGSTIIMILIIVSLLYFITDRNKLNIDVFSIDLTFIGVISTLASIALALIAIGLSIKEADIRVFLGDEHITLNSSLKEIRVSNRGNALGNITHALVEIEVLQSNQTTFQAVEGLQFHEINNSGYKQYRLVSPQEPHDLYPVRKQWHLLGYIKIPAEIKNSSVKFSVQIIGTQGFVRKEFNIDI